MKGLQLFSLSVIIFCIYIVVALVGPLKRFQASNSLSFEMPLGTTNFSMRLVSGAHVLRIGEKTLGVQQSMVVFAVTGELITNVETNYFNVKYNPSLKYPCVYYHFDVPKGQNEVRVAFNISALGETTNTFYVQCFPVK